MPDTLLEALQRTREDYSEECQWHRFLIDAYAGTGGFCGRVKTPRVGYLGAAATAYSSGFISVNAGSIDVDDTYLDRFPREDDPKFQRRMDVAHYDNYLGPITDVFVSYLNTARNTSEGVPPSVEEWTTDVTGTGTTWDDLLASIVRPRAALLGWCPVLLDRDSAPEGVAVQTRAQEQALGLALRAVPLFPSNVLEWEVDPRDGQLTWIKLYDKRCERPDPLAGSIEFDEYRIFTRETFSVFRVSKDKSGQGSVETVADNVPHNAGAVPVVIFRAKPTPSDPVRGIGMVGEIASAQRRHFNLLSEQDEHIRGNVFAILGIPVKDTTQDIGSAALGTGSAMKVPMDANMPLHYVAPPASVAETLETRIENVVREMHRMARAPFENDKGGAQAADALAQKFELSNRKIGDAAASLARGEQETLRKVASMLEESDPNAITVAPQREFRADNIGTDLDNALKVMGLPGMVPTAKRVTISRVVDKYLHNLTSEQRAAIDKELLAQSFEAAAPAAPAPPAAPATGAGAGQSGKDNGAGGQGAQTPAG